MSGTILRQVQIPVEPSMKDLLDLFRKDLLQNLNCHHIGTIQSFSATDQLASATINYPQTYYAYNQNTNTNEPYQVPYPPLTDCPVIILGGGATSLTFPIKAGDQCLVLFNDRDLDNWYNGATGAQVATPRLHSFSDALILVGMYSSASSPSSYSTTHATLQNGTTQVGVSSTKVKLANATNGTLGTSMATFLTALQTFMTATAAASTVSQIASAASAFTTATTVAITDIKGILE